MTSRGLEFFNRRVEVLFRQQRGDLRAAIAKAANCHPNAVAKIARRARQDPRVVEAVAMRKAEEERKAWEE